MALVGQAVWLVINVMNQVTNVMPAARTAAFVMLTLSQAAPNRRSF
jgi:hypothetical protein